MPATPTIVFTVDTSAGDTYIPLGNDKDFLVFAWNGDCSTNKDKLNYTSSADYKVTVVDNDDDISELLGDKGVKTVAYYEKFSWLGSNGKNNYSMVDAPYYDVKRAETTSFNNAFAGARGFTGNDRRLIEQIECQSSQYFLLPLYFHSA